MSEQQNLSIREAARWLGVSTRTVYRLVQQGGLPGFRVGGQWRFSQALLEGWVADRVTVERLRAEARQGTFRKPTRRKADDGALE